MIVFFCASPSSASTSDKLVVRESVSAAQREELASRLRKITGWSKLTFNNDGAMQANMKEIVGGSTIARELLSAAFAGKHTILFEDASSRKDVVFCRVVSGKLLPAIYPNEDVHVIQIDFTDFHQVIGDKEALAAFDVGWAVLHEIDHVISNSSDPVIEDVAGDCEGHINEIRRELGLPVRNNYFYDFLPVKNDSNLISRFVRLGFDLEGGPEVKKKRYWLIWDAAIVGGLS
ncbi:MAG TPA: hypothetical protein VFZ71_04095 [Pyrinomonadaceae bacterium]